jgi:hypothetical protein
VHVVALKHHIPTVTVWQSRLPQSPFHLEPFDLRAVIKANIVEIYADNLVVTTFNFKLMRIGNAYASDLCIMPR